MAEQTSEIRYLAPQTQDIKKKKYCRFKKAGIKYIDYKDPEFLKRFLNEQGKLASAPSHHRYFTQVPASRGSGRKESTSLGSSALRNRYDEVIIFKE